jgi:hypothetical protein
VGAAGEILEHLVITLCVYRTGHTRRLRHLHEPHRSRESRHHGSARNESTATVRAMRRPASLALPHDISLSASSERKFHLGSGNVNRPDAALSQSTARAESHHRKSLSGHRAATVMATAAHCVRVRDRAGLFVLRPRHRVRERENRSASVNLTEITADHVSFKRQEDASRRLIPRRIQGCSSHVGFGGLR